MAQWLPLNVSVLATNRNCLLVQTILRLAGFHRQPSLGLLRGLLYSEVCKSRSASGIELEITTFRKSLLYFLFLCLLFFFGGQKIFFVCHKFIGHSHSISQHRPRIPCATLLRARRLLLQRLGLLVNIGVHTS